MIPNPGDFECAVIVGQEDSSEKIATQYTRGVKKDPRTRALSNLLGAKVGCIRSTQ